MISKPNFFLVAAPRSGSTQLANWLAQHSQIYLPPIKEPNFFSEEEFSQEYVARTFLNDIDPAYYVKQKLSSIHQFAIFRDIYAYEYLYRNIESTVRLDASTSYLHHKGAAKKIKNYSKDSKVLILLRQPVERLISHYHLALRTGRIKDALRNEIERELNGKMELCEQYLVRQSLYSDAVTEYLDVFPTENVKIIFFEKLIENSKGTVGEIFNFLNIDSESIIFTEDDKNASVAPRFMQLNYFISRTGFKTFARRVFPRSFKQLLKKIYFSNSKANVDYQALEVITDILQEDYENFLELVPEAKYVWKSPSSVINDYLNA